MIKLEYRDKELGRIRVKIQEVDNDYRLMNGCKRSSLVLLPEGENLFREQSLIFFNATYDPNDVASDARGREIQEAYSKLPLFFKANSKSPVEFKMEILDFKPLIHKWIKSTSKDVLKELKGTLVLRLNTLVKKSNLYEEFSIGKLVGDFDSYNLKILLTSYWDMYDFSYNIDNNSMSSKYFQKYNRGQCFIVPYTLVDLVEEMEKYKKKNQDLVAKRKKEVLDRLLNQLDYEIEVKLLDFKDM